MIPFTARRAEEFAAAVDGVGTAHVDAGSPIVELVGVAALLRSHADAAPRAEFASDLRARLMAEAQTVLTPQTANLLLPARPRGKRERRLVAAATAVVLVGGGASMAAAAQQALPGEALYGIKRGIEQAQASLSLSPASKGRDLLGQAQDRLDEVSGLLADESAAGAPQVPDTLEDFSTQAQDGADLLFSSFQEDRDPDSVVAVRTFAADGLSVLKGLADRTPPEAQDELTAAALTLRDIDQQAADLCPTCASDLPALSLPGMFLARAEADRALGSLVTAKLDNSHPVVADRAAVEQAAKAAAQLAEASVEGDAGSSTEGQATATPTPQEWSAPSLSGGDGSGGNTDVGGTTDKTVQDLSDGLNGAVETLLPDSDTSLLP